MSCLPVSDGEGWTLYPDGCRWGTHDRMHNDPFWRMRALSIEPPRHQTLTMLPGANKTKRPRRFNDEAFHKLAAPKRRLHGLYIMPPMPPIPPMSPPAGIGASSFGSSATIASVVIIRPATDAAFCNAERVTLVGSRMPDSTMSP